MNVWSETKNMHVTCGKLSVTCGAGVKVRLVLTADCAPMACFSRLAVTALYAGGPVDKLLCSKHRIALMSEVI